MCFFFFFCNITSFFYKSIFQYILYRHLIEKNNTRLYNNIYVCIHDKKSNFNRRSYSHFVGNVYERKKNLIIIFYVLFEFHIELRLLEKSKALYIESFPSTCHLSVFQQPSESKICTIYKRNNIKINYLTRLNVLIILILCHVSTIFILPRIM